MEQNPLTYQIIIPANKNNANEEIRKIIHAKKHNSKE